LQDEKPELAMQLQSQLIEAAWSLRNWDVLDNLAKKPHDRSFESDIGLILSAAYREDKAEVTRRIKETREWLFSPLSTAFTESYRRAYTPMLQLHMLHELELRLYSLLDRDNDTTSICMPSRDTLKRIDWDARLQIVASSFKAREPIVRLRHAVEDLLW
jgi:hypothetical protein